MSLLLRRVVIVSAWLFALPCFALGQETDQGSTLGVLRSRYLGQRVVISGHLGLGGTISEWEKGREKAPGDYETHLQAYLRGAVPYDQSFNLLASYNGQEATVVAIQLHDGRTHSERPEQDVFGDPIGLLDTRNPTVTMVVRFDDGTFGMLAPLPANLVEVFSVMLLSVRDNRKELMEKELPSVIGRALYATAGYFLYEPDTPFEEFFLLASRAKHVQNVPLLQPLVIERARFVENHNMVLLRLRLPDGRYALFRSSYRDEGVLPIFREMGIVPPDADSFLARIASPFLTRIPDSLTDDEVEAVQKGKIFTGMKREAIFYLLGFPQRQNDYGLGGKQWVYDDGKIMVYLDREGTVTDFQVLE